MKKNEQKCRIGGGRLRSVETNQRCMKRPACVHVACVETIRVKGKTGRNDGGAGGSQVGSRHLRRGTGIGGLARVLR